VGSLGTCHQFSSCWNTLSYYSLQNMTNVVFIKNQDNFLILGLFSITTGLVLLTLMCSIY
jgi:hypothetical protein